MAEILINRSAEECITQYMNLSKEAFDSDHAIFKVMPTGEKGCRFDASNLERIIKELINEKLKNEKETMAEIAIDEHDKPCRTFVVATSAAVAQGAPILFRSYSTKENNANKCAIWQAARATSAAPSFFDPIHIEIPAPGGWYVDGGLRHNNPSQLALEEARRIWPRIKRFCLVSVGTGRQSNVEFVNIKDVEPPSRKPKGAISRMLPKIPVVRTVKNAPSGAKKLIDIGKACVEMSTSSVPVHEAMVSAANAADPHPRFPYFHFNVESGMDTIGLEEWKARVRIGELTHQYMQEETCKIEKMSCIKTLISPAVVERTYPFYFAVKYNNVQIFNFRNLETIFSSLRSINRIHILWGEISSLLNSERSWPRINQKHTSTVLHFTEWEAWGKHKSQPSMCLNFGLNMILSSGSLRRPLQTFNLASNKLPMRSSVQAKPQRTTWRLLRKPFSNGSKITVRGFS